MQKIFKTIALASAFLTMAGGAFAQYPEKPIKVIVGYSAGGGTDVMASYGCTIS